MLDPTAQQVGVGGALFLAALGLLLKYKPWERKDDNGNKKQGNNAGQQATSFWELTFTRLIDTALKPVVKQLDEVLRNQRELLDRERDK